VDERLAPYMELTKELLARVGTRDVSEPLSAEILAAFRELCERSEAV
jgi:hypothetical protein